MTGSPFRPATRLNVSGFADDTIVTARPRSACGSRRSRAAPGACGSRSRSRSPPASAAAAPTRHPRSGSRTSCSTDPLDGDRLEALAATIGADVPFFLRTGPQLGTGDGTVLDALDLPAGLLGRARPAPGALKSSTRTSTRAFDARNGADRFRRAPSRTPRRPRRRPAAAATWHGSPRTISLRLRSSQRLPRGRRVPRRCQRRRPVRLRPLRQRRRADAAARALRPCRAHLGDDAPVWFG